MENVIIHAYKHVIDYTVQGGDTRTALTDYDC